MARIKIELPAQFHFSTTIPIRITDLNYGGHVGNDTILSLIHEARVQFLLHHGYEELNLAGVGVIMSDVGIEFKQELFHGDIVTAYVAAGDFSKITFDLFYKLEKNVAGKPVTVATAKTGMVCYDYDKKKVVAVPVGVRETLQS
jgi:acyl-CoA thioester hydrolase